MKVFNDRNSCNISLKSLNWKMCEVVGEIIKCSQFGNHFTLKKKKNRIKSSPKSCITVAQEKYIWLLKEFCYLKSNIRLKTYYKTIACKEY